MSSDDSDPSHGEEAETGQSGAGDADDGPDGQPRDPETGQFLPKDRRRNADANDDSDDADRETEGSESDPNDAAAERDAPGVRLRITRVPVGGDSGPAVDPTLPPPLHLVAMQVQLTGEPVRPIAGEPVELDGARRRPR